MDRPPITPRMKVAELLEAYPELEDTLIAQAPAFRRLKNPVLRKTVARVTTLEAAAKVGGVSGRDLVTALRKAAGQPVAEEFAESGEQAPEPEWVLKGTVVETIDADAMLAAGEVPLGAVVAAAGRLSPGSLVKVTSGFHPQPLIDALRNAGHGVHCSQVGPERFETFIARKPEG